MCALCLHCSVGDTNYLHSISSSVMTPLKPSSISSFFAAKPSSIAKKQKPQVIVIDVDEGPDEAVIVVVNAGTKKDSSLVDVVCVIDGESLLVSFLVVANPADVT